MVKQDALFTHLQNEYPNASDKAAAALASATSASASATSASASAATAQAAKTVAEGARCRNYRFKGFTKPRRQDVQP